MHNKIIMVIAPKRSGKTHKVSQMVAELDCVAAFDMIKDAQYMEIKTRKNEEPVVVIEGNPAMFARAISRDKEKFKVIYHPAICKMQDNGIVECPEFQPIIKLCHLRGNMYLVIDEAHMFCNSYNCPPELMMASYIGGHNGFSMILIAQSFVGIHPIIRRNADEIYFWRITEPSDLEVIRKRCGKDVEEAVTRLRAVELDEDNNFIAPGQMLHWSKYKGIVEITENEREK
jgi:hypothetical protein